MSHASEKMSGDATDCIEARIVPADSRRVVIKVGSSLLIDADGRPDTAFVATLAGEVEALSASVVLVSSGAVALGRGPLGLAGRLTLEEKQAAAAAGQARLMRVWGKAFTRPVAQVLLSWGDTEERRRWLNARATMDALLRLGAVPVVNENDTVATAELRFGDNDRLAARVAQMVGADRLVLLSDVDGLYDADPRAHPAARHIARVEALTPDVLTLAGGAGEGPGTGGMATKLAAARIAQAAGCVTVIAAGKPPGGHPLSAPERWTEVAAATTPLAARKAWIAATLDSRGAIVVDAGAADALRRGASLLPAGVKAVAGTFGKGDAVRVVDETGDEIARGLVRRDFAEVERVAGLSSDAAATMGVEGRPELIHADDLVVTR